jgi:choline-glycine betaine transporter
MQVGGVAVIATTSALLAKPLADILLKVVKPTVKKVMKKIAKIRGKTVKVMSTAERRNEQRDRNHAIMALRQTLKPK